MHALIEIDDAPGVTAAELAEALLLDRTTLSRLLRKLIDAGEVREDQGAEDRRKLDTAKSQGERVRQYQVSEPVPGLAADAGF